jgi:hypothetical protein
MPAEILVVIPTKGRPAKFRRFARSWQKTTEGRSNVVVGLDVGETAYDQLKGRYPFVYEHVTPKPFLHIVNELALKYADQYRYLAFMEDDCVYVSTNWESAFIRALEELGDNGIVWGADGLNGERLVGLPVMQASIVRRLGFMSPPELKCLWADNYWKDLGQALGSSRYLPEVLIRHEHYITTWRHFVWKKLRGHLFLPASFLRDEVSVAVDRTGANEDVKAYESYRVQGLPRDVLTLTK